MYFSRKLLTEAAVCASISSRWTAFFVTFLQLPPDALPGSLKDGSGSTADSQAGPQEWTSHEFLRLMSEKIMIVAFKPLLSFLVLLEDGWKQLFKRKSAGRSYFIFWSFPWTRVSSRAVTPLRDLGSSLVIHRSLKVSKTDWFTQYKESKEQTWKQLYIYQARLSESDDIPMRGAVNHTPHDFLQSSGTSCSTHVKICLLFLSVEGHPRRSSWVEFPSVSS